MDATEAGEEQMEKTKADGEDAAGEEQMEKIKWMVMASEGGSRKDPAMATR